MVLNKNNEPQPIQIKVNGREFSIDLSGLKTQIGETAGNLKVESASATDDLYKLKENDTERAAKLSDLQENITAGELGADGKTIKVSGKSLYIGNYVGFDKPDSDRTHGYYVALRLSYPGLKPSDIKFKSVDGNPWKALSTLTTEESNPDGVLVWRLSKDLTGAVKPLVVSAGGKEYTVDLSGIAWGNGDMITVEAPSDSDVNDNDPLLMKGETGSDGKKTISELQSGIEIADDGSGTYRVTGTLNHITSYSAWEASAKGYFVVLKLTYPGADAMGDIQFRSVDGEGAGKWKKLDTDGLLVWKVTEGKNITVKAEDQEFTIDLSGLTLGSESNLLDIQAANQNLIPIGPNKKVSDLQKEDVKIINNGDGTYTAEGTLLYNYYDKFSSSNNLKDGYYLALDVTTRGLMPTQIEIYSPSEQTWKQFNGDFYSVSWIAAENGKVTTEEISLRAWDKIFTIDVSGLKLDVDLDVKAADTNDWALNDLAGHSLDEVQDGLNVVQSGDTFKVDGTAYYIENWTQYDNGNTALGDINDGYFVALRIDFPGTADKDVDVSSDCPEKYGIKIITDHRAQPGVQMKESGDVLLMRIAAPSGERFSNATITVGDYEFTIDISNVRLVNPNISAFNMGSDIAAQDDWFPMDEVEGVDNIGFQDEM